MYLAPQITAPAVRESERNREPGSPEPQRSERDGGQEDEPAEIHVTLREAEGSWMCGFMTQKKNDENDLNKRKQRRAFLSEEIM